jgi:hypothetical protein
MYAAIFIVASCYPAGAMKPDSSPAPAQVDGNGAASHARAQDGNASHE